MRYHSYKSRILLGKDLEIDRPTLSFFDYEHLIELNLQRTIISHIPDDVISLLEVDICRDILAYLLILLPQTNPIFLSFSNISNINKYKAKFSNGSTKLSDLLLFTKFGMGLFTDWHINKIKINKIISSSKASVSKIEILFDNDQKDFAYISEDTLRINKLELKGLSLLTSINNHSEEIIKKTIELLGGYTINGADIDKAGFYLKNYYNWSIINIGETPQSDAIIDSIVTLSEPSMKDYINVLYLNTNLTTDPISLSPIEQTWRDIIKLSYIPYDKIDRKSKLSAAYIELEKYIKNHEVFINNLKE